MAKRSALAASPIQLLHHRARVGLYRHIRLIAGGPVLIPPTRRVARGIGAVRSRTNIGKRLHISGWDVGARRVVHLYGAVYR